MKRTVKVERWVDVTVDDAKFTPEFMTEFRKHFYDFRTVEDHMLHLGQLRARGMIDLNRPVEGYGMLSDFGVVFDEDGGYDDSVGFVNPDDLP